MCLSLKKPYHTFIADVTSAYFHVDQDEECYVDPPAAFNLRALATAGTAVWSETRSKTLGGLDGRCGAVPKFFANCELDVFLEVHMGDLHSTRAETGTGADPSEPLAVISYQHLDSE